MEAVRSHWAVENYLHWTPDVVFKEDNFLKKKGNSALNYKVIAKMANNNGTGNRIQNSKPKKMLLAALDEEFRLSYWVANFKSDFPSLGANMALREKFNNGWQSLALSGSVIYINLNGGIYKL